jgi:hypothetical protein
MSGKHIKINRSTGRFTAFDIDVNYNAFCSEVNNTSERGRGWCRPTAPWPKPRM